MRFAIRLRRLHLVFASGRGGATVVIGLVLLVGAAMLAVGSVLYAGA